MQTIDAVALSGSVGPPAAPAAPRPPLANKKGPAVGSGWAWRPWCLRAGPAGERRCWRLKAAGLAGLGSG